MTRLPWRAVIAALAVGVAAPFAWAVLMLALLWLATCATAQAAESPPRVMLEITGRSMEPTLRAGERHALIVVPFTAALRGAVIVWRDNPNGKLVAHRCIKFGVAGNGEPYAVTKGDANAERDFVRVSRDQFRGIIDVPVRR